MGEAKTKQAEFSIASDAKSKTPKNIMEGRRTQELVIAFCGPIGSGVTTVAQAFEESFKNYDYEVVYIKISKLILQVGQEQGYKIEEDKMQEPGGRIQELQCAGNFLRKKFGNDILAQLAIQKIAIERKKKEGSAQDNSSEKSDRILDFPQFSRQLPFT